VTAGAHQCADPPASAAGYGHAMRASLDEMPALAAWADSVLAAIDVGASRAYAVQLCLEELVVNVILHAVPPTTAPLTVAIRIQPSGAALELVVEDNGGPFDPTQAASSSAAPDLSSEAIGGRGLLLVGKFAQALTYSRVNEHNRIALDFTG
jgi:serine/threonine-protein kinase RsbW